MSAGEEAPVVLITRPEPDGAAFAEALRRAAPGPWRAVLAPLARIASLPPPALPEGAELILTSRNAVRVLRASGALRGAAGRRAWCVGGATAEAADEAGLAAVAGGGTADALVAEILARRPRAPLVHLRGAEARGEVAARLRGGGLDAREAVIYRQQALDPGPEARAALSGAAGGGAVIAPVFSPRAAALLTDAARAAGGGRALHAVALSPAVAAALRLPGARVRVCDRPEAEAMVAAVAALLAGRAEPG